jgi:hypothetical protein
MRKSSVAGVASPSEELHRELRAITQELRRAYDRFNYVADPELVEASIYEINSLKAKCNYLLRRIKEEEGEGRCRVVFRPDEEACLAASAGEGGPVCPS